MESGLTKVYWLSMESYIIMEIFIIIANFKVRKLL